MRSGCCRSNRFSAAWKRAARPPQRQRGPRQPGRLQRRQAQWRPKSHAGRRLLHLSKIALEKAVGRRVESAGGNGSNKAMRPLAAKGNGPDSSGRERAADDPIVRRVQEKFGAEIRTVIDYRDKQR